MLAQLQSHGRLELGDRLRATGHLDRGHAHRARGFEVDAYSVGEAELREVPSHGR